MKALNSPIKASNSSFLKTHFLKAPSFRTFFNSNPFSYNTHFLGLHEKKRVFLFPLNCQLKNPRGDTKPKGNTVSKKILLSEAAPPSLTEDDGGDGEAPVNSRSKDGISGIVKMVTKRVLAVMSNLPLAIGEMFMIAALMALGEICLSF